MNTVWLNRTAYTHILEEALSKMPCETGGVLMGYWGSEGEAVVTAIIGPGPKAVHKLSSFVPDDAYHKQEISRHYQQSGQTETYLGDWHTHPFSKAYLSDPDKKTLRKIADFKHARLAKPLMMILGTQPFGLTVWAHTYVKRYCRTKPVIADCTLAFYDTQK
jgi:integrative and conjugative element protein (TIGR02256 family)